MITLCNRLDRPGPLDERRGQPVEQLGVGGRRRPGAPKSLGVRTSPWPKWCMPDPVDHHPGRERVVGLEAIALASSSRPLPSVNLGRSGTAPRSPRGTGGGPACPGRPGLPRRKTCGSIGLGLVDHHHRPGGGSRMAARRPARRAFFSSARSLFRSSLGQDRTTAGRLVGDRLTGPSGRVEPAPGGRRGSASGLSARARAISVAVAPGHDFFP